MPSGKLRLRKVKIKDGVVHATDWGSLWDLFNSIAGDARGSDTWICDVPSEDCGIYTFRRIKEVAV